MEKQQIDWFRAQLLELRTRVAAEAADHGRFLKPNDGDNLLDPEEQATRAGEDLVEAQITEDRSDSLRKIEVALGRLESGVYQQCANCGKEISLERLRAEPAALLCVDCQEAHEAGALTPSR
jgi:DnaK suppressor protein